MVFEGHPSNYKVARLKKSSILTQIGPFRTVTPIYFTNGYEMMHKAWSSIEGVPYCFPRSSVKFQGHTGQIITDFDTNWGFLDCNLSLNLPMALKWFTKLDVVERRCPIIVRGHPSNFKSHRLKNLWFESNLSKITGQVAAIKSLRFSLFKSFLQKYSALRHNCLSTGFVRFQSNLPKCLLITTPKVSNGFLRHIWESSLICDTIDTILPRLIGCFLQLQASCMSGSRVVGFLWGRWRE